MAAATGTGSHGPASRLQRGGSTAADRPPPPAQVQPPRAAAAPRSPSTSETPEKLTRIEFAAPFHDAPGRGLPTRTERIKEMTTPPGRDGPGRRVEKAPRWTRGGVHRRVRRLLFLGEDQERRRPRRRGDRARGAA